MDDVLKYYEILGLKPGANEDEIKQAYRDLVKVWHPDRFAGSPRLQDKAQEKLKDINLAYEYLKSHHYTPSPEQEHYDFGGEEYQQEETPPQEEKVEREERTTTYTTTYKRDSFLSGIPKWVMIVIALVLIWALSSYFNTPSKPKKTDYKPPLYSPVTSKPLLPPIELPRATETQKLKEPITKPLMKPLPPKTAKPNSLPVMELGKPRSNPSDAPFKEELLKETANTSQPSEEDLKYAEVKEQIKKIEKKLEGYKKDLSQSPDKVATLRSPQRSVTPNYFTVGSSKEEVLAVQGTPSSIIGDTWHYGYSSVDFYNGRVKGYSNISKNLRVKLAPQADSSTDRQRDYFSLGSSQEEVLAVQGTPSGIIGSTWHYSYSSIDFLNGRVKGYSNISRNLHVKLLPKAETFLQSPGYFTIGSTQDEVLAVQGTPTGIIGNTWYYGYSSIDFLNGKVAGYSDISINLNVK